MYDLTAMIDRIKEVKKQKGLTNDTLSELSGVSRGTLSKILGSETKDPQISSIIKISQALGVSADYIIFGSDRSSHAEQSEISVASESLNEEGKAKVLSYIQDLKETGKYSGVTNIPQDIKNTVKAGSTIQTPIKQK